MAIYCPTCNRSSENTPFIGDFCEYCIADKIKKTLPKEIKVYQCRFCNKIKVVNTFVEEEKGALAGAIAHALGKDCKVKIAKHERGGIVKFHVNYPYDDTRVRFDYELKLRILHETCQRCYQVSVGYYEAVIQLRGNRMKMDKIAEKLRKYIEKGDGFISKIENVLNGVDIYVSDKELAGAFFFDKELKPERSFRLYGVKRGRKVYRNTYAVHL